MIIWLASYPRSGNTLFRTICRHCFGMYSYADEPVDYESEFRSNPELIGHREIPGEWAQFYRQASQSSEIYLVKTHRPPVDEQPYIYIVRDGRSSLISYQKFNKNFNALDVSLIQLILGFGGYGSWSEHYYSWNKRPGIKHLVFQFENLINISDHQLMRIADFFEYDKKPASWVNPVDRLQEVEPGFFGDQRKQFAGDKRWCPRHEYLFSKMHGKLMHELGYAQSQEKSNADFSAQVDQMMTEIVSYITGLQQENRMLAKTCEERLELINQLNGICEDRLRLINSLHRHPDQK